MAHVEVERRRDDDQAGEGSGLPSPEEPSNRDHARDAGDGRDKRGDRGAPLRHAAEGDRSRRYGPEEELGLVEVVLAAELGDEPPAVIEGVLRQERESRVIRRPERAASRRGGDDHHGEDEHAENARPGTPSNTAHCWPGYTRSSGVLYARDGRPPPLTWSCEPEAVAGPQCEPQPQARRACDRGRASRSRRRGEPVNVAVRAAAAGEASL